MATFPNPETQFKAGESGNPAGKPKGTRNRSTILREFSELKDLKSDGNPASHPLVGEITVEQAIMLALIEQAKKGDVSAIKEIQDTLYGKITEKIENAHTFTQMGRVKVGEGEIGFDVGAPVDAPDQSE